MQGTVAVTDYGWYQHLSRGSFREVNFWTPSDRRGFSSPVFSPFFFKLKAPHNAICGFAYFARYSSLPDWLAWECFGEGNGAATLGEMQRSIRTIRLRNGINPDEQLSSIGCIVLVEPHFFLREEWLPQPLDWSANIVSAKRYDLSHGEGKRLWEACLERAYPARPSLTTGPSPLAADPQRYGTPQLVAPRLGQGAFRVAVTEAYGRACAVTGEHSLPALDAAHIRAYGSGGMHAVPNGLLLRADVHRLFDLGYMTVTPEHRIEVSRRLRDDYSNGHSYYPRHGNTIYLPHAEADRPDADALRWHNDNVYLG